MGPAGNLAQWYLRLSRIFGVFPLSRSADGILRYSVCSLSTILSMTYAVSYSLCMLHYMYFVLNEKHLSYRLMITPCVVVSASTDYLTRIGSMYYGNAVVKLMVLTDHGESNGKTLRKGFIVVPIVYPALSLIRVIRAGVLGNETQFSANDTTNGTDWDGPFDLWIGFSFIARDGAFWSALCFLHIFGQRVMLCFHALCTEILEHYCETSNQDGKLYPGGGAFQIGSKAKALACVKMNPDLGEKFVDSFVRVKLAFDIYAKIGGVLVFALVVDIGTWLFYLAGSVLLFSTEEVDSTFAFPFVAAQSILVVLVLLSIAELGDQMECQVIGTVFV